MKLNQLALAAVAVFGATQAFAANTYLTGASASSANVMKAAKNLCADAGGTFKLFKTNTTTNALGNQFTGVCTTDISGTSFSQVRMNVAGGSASAVTATTGAATTFLAPVEGSCTSIVGTESLSTFNLFKCPAAQLNDNHLSDGGYLDVEGPIFNSTYAAEDFTIAGFSQAFGVAVNSTLYNALQTAQFGASNSCVTNTTLKYTAACQPSVTKAKITSLISGDTSSDAKQKGGQFLVGGTTDVTKITYCMRPQTSGTQQSAQLYFLNYAASGSNGGKELVVAQNLNVGTKYSSFLNSGSSDVKNCLNDVTGGTGYKVGILSAENNPLGGTDTFRFIKLNGVAVAQGVDLNDSNTATALTGDYDFVYETSAYCPAGTCPEFVQAIIDNITVALPVGSSTAGLFLTGVESKYSRGGNSGAPFASRN